MSDLEQLFTLIIYRISMAKKKPIKKTSKKTGKKC